MTGLIYIHVPKCGGTSFGTALRLRYLTSQASISLNQGDRRLSGEAQIISDYRARQVELRGHVSRGIRLIAGHVQYDPILHAGSGRNYGYITLLRNPVDRLLSHYHYLERKHPNPARPSQLEAFLDTPDALRLASQYLFYFAGQSQLRRSNSKPLVARAMRALARFDFVGDLSDPMACATGLRTLTGGPLPVWHRNRAPKHIPVPNYLRPKLEALCAPDMEIFESCRHHRAVA